MQAWRNLSIPTKVMAAFAVVFVTTVALGLFGLSQTAAVNDKAAEVRDNWLPSTNQLGRLTAAVAEYRVMESRIVIAGAVHDTSGQAANIADLKAAQATVDKAYADYQPLIAPGTDDERLMREFAAAWSDFKASSGRVVELSAGADAAATIALYRGEDRRHFDAASGRVIADMDFNAGEGRKAADAGAATYALARMMTLGALALCGLLCVAVGYGLVRNVGAPLRLISAAVDRLASGDLSVSVSEINREDEIGKLARSLEVFKGNAAEARRLSEEAAAAQAARDQRTARIDGLVRGFEAHVSATVNHLASGSTELETTARSMSQTADRTNQQAAAVASAAEEAGTGVQTVASAAEELTASIHEISRQVAQSAKITSKAVADAERTDGIVRALADGADKIGQVIGLISDIAGQTNLLALNATIEAARAGDAGKGFAVVASEVKNLATQTAKATDDISSQISQIQAATKEAVEAIRGIAGTITEVNTIATAIASAVEEQGSATAEIARNVQETAHATRDVTTHITSVSQAAQETGAAAGHVLTAAESLSKQSEALNREVGSFVADVRAA